MRVTTNPNRLHRNEQSGFGADPVAAPAVDSAVDSAVASAVDPAGGPDCPDGIAANLLAADIRELRRCVQAGGCDLHLHSRASDGALSPAELAAAVTGAGLKTVALTDHDSVGGVAEMQTALAALEAAGRPVPRLIPGVELSVDGCGRELHLLGYFMSGNPGALQADLAAYLATRQARNRRMCEQLQALGYDITMSELLRAAGGHQAGRPHAAQLLCQKGYFSSVRAVFDALLAEGRPGYVPRRRPPVEAAIASVRRAGGIPVLAHPALYGWTKDSADLTAKLAGLQAVGLAGVEVIHGETARADSAVIAAAQALGLLRTVGSDFHGAVKPHVPLIDASADFGPWLGSS